jgi:hypothetical protein
MRELFCRLKNPYKNWPLLLWQPRLELRDNRDASNRKSKIGESQFFGGKKSEEKQLAYISMNIEQPLQANQNISRLWSLTR